MATCTRDLVEDEEHIFRSQLPEVQVPNDITLPEFVLQNAELYGEHVAFVEAVSGKAYTYSKVVRDTNRFAKALSSLRLRKGQVVLVVLPNVAEYAIVALGIMAAGGVFSGVNPAAHILEIKKQMETAEAKLVVTDSANFEKVKIETVVFITPSQVFRLLCLWLGLRTGKGIKATSDHIGGGID